MISIDHVIQGSCDFMDESVSLFVTTLPDLVAVKILCITFLVVGEEDSPCLFT